MGKTTEGKSGAVTKRKIMDKADNNKIVESSNELVDLGNSKQTAKKVTKDQIEDRSVENAMNTKRVKEKKKKEVKIKELNTINVKSGIV